ncbi:RNA polymerase sigma factor [Actinosynnema sp. NPDC053489]|uniref:RNA polymerase sigma factor n=1 Tax=Actinosynnema sp. NPDC053489 TaxID=3363916 RepID=UPI0037C6ED56
MDGEPGRAAGSEAFDEFFRRELAPLVAFVRRAGFGWEQAKDAAQEAMIKAYQDWTGIRRPRAWVRSVAHRVAVAEVVRARDGVLRAVSGGWTASTHHDPDVAALGEEHERLLAALRALPGRQRLVMAWHLDGFDHVEIAAQLDVPPTTVRSNLRHARNALKSRFAATRTR